MCHGDIKCENVMVTSWNWLLLVDFASYKPTYIPADNPVRRLHSLMTAVSAALPQQTVCAPVTLEGYTPLAFVIYSLFMCHMARMKHLELRASTALYDPLWLLDCLG